MSTRKSNRGKKAPDANKLDQATIERKPTDAELLAIFDKNMKKSASPWAAAMLRLPAETRLAYARRAMEKA